MHIHSSLHWMAGVIGVLLVFMAGFYIGTLDAEEHTIKVTGQCAGIGVEKSFSSNFESVNGKVIRDEKTNSETYTARCLCFASDATHENIWVDTVEISGDSKDNVQKECSTNCQALCEERLTGFVFAD